MDKKKPAVKNGEDQPEKAQQTTPERRDSKKQDAEQKRALELAKKALLLLRASDPQTIDDLPIKNYSPEEIYRMIMVHCTALAEHTDTVQIFVTTQQEGKTSAFCYGVGNHFARKAQVEDWLDLQMAERYEEGGDLQED